MKKPAPENLPRHVGIIMDGNGRWAKARGLPRIAGHRQGATTVDTIVTACRQRGIQVLTLYAFSSQNWARPSTEVKALMTLLGDYLQAERTKILNNNIRLTAIGELSRLPSRTARRLADLMTASDSNTGMVLCLALSYGGREEIVSATRTLCEKVAHADLRPEDLTEDLFSRHLWSSALGPVDLLIRTSGEQRLSNFLLWSCAYSEFYFTPRMWPEFDVSDLDAALSAFTNRHRRYGDIDEAF